ADSLQRILHRIQVAQLLLTQGSSCALQEMHSGEPRLEVLEQRCVSEYRGYGTDYSRSRGAAYLTPHLSPPPQGGRRLIRAANTHGKVGRTIIVEVSHNFNVGVPCYQEFAWGTCHCSRKRSRLHARAHVLAFQCQPVRRKETPLSAGFLQVGELYCLA